MRYLFWNTNRNPDINTVLCDLVVENDISIVILAEYAADMNELIAMLSERNRSMKEYLTIGCERIRILAKTGLDMVPQKETDHSSVQIMNHKMVLCCVHLNSKLSSASKGRREIALEKITADILEAEQKLNARNTIVVGDFNINPYEESCMDARYFHGLSVYEESKRESRIVEGQEFYMFYNPMWNFLGDFREPYGTYYYNSGDPVNAYWNIYDQVIIRPALRPLFVDASLKIITGTRRRTFLDEKKHPADKISDHLPIMFELKEDDL